MGGADRDEEVPSGWTLCALCVAADVEAAERIIFTETTTFGVRRKQCRRSKLVRASQTVETPCGPIRVKVGLLAGRVVTASPEFSDCRRAAEAHGMAVRDVYEQALRAYRDQGVRQ